MFLKKKTACKHTLILETNPNGEEQREGFRYVFSKTDQPMVRFRDKPVRVLDISAGGMAFENQGFGVYDAGQITFDFHVPGCQKITPFSAWTRILYITANDVCHCIFEGLNVNDYEIIHKYVLELQKLDLKSRRGSRARL